ncbi:MAG: DUF4238 domain-containing protein [Nanoarchaeota archaeon]|nr:DUF4238 domain-containing protein [Nanoarchaeota archaeon]
MVKIEQKVRLQHYVPRVYLRNFSNYNGKKYYIWVFDKETEEIFQTNIENIAFEEEFYDTVDEEQIAEKTLCNIESRFGGAITNLINSKDLAKISSEDLDSIAEFIAVQMIRTKETRISVKQTSKQFLEKFEGHLSEKLRLEAEKSMEKSSLRKGHKRMILENKEMFKRIIKEMKWILISNKLKTPFWSSDDPVAKHNSIDHFPYGNLGLTSTGIEVHFPLTPNLCLTICDPILFKKESSKKNTRDYRNIIRERDLQVRYSTRFIFSNENKFDFAKTMLKEDPSLKDPDRKRVTIM